jgi:hypothetical protein
MRRAATITFALCWFLLSCSPGGRAKKQPAPDGVPEFSLLDHEGVSRNLYREGDAPAVVLIGQGNDCPIIRKYTSRIRELAVKWRERGVPFYLINANPQDSRRDVQREILSYNFGAPVLLDPSQLVTRSLGITRTAEAVIVETGTWKVLYRGAIDDRLGYGMDKRVPAKHFLDNALEDIASGRTVREAPPPAKGCLFSFADHGKPTYVSHAAKILRTRCLDCHAKGGYFPPAFDSYETVKGWSKMIRETLLTDRMPPLSYDPHYGKFRNYPGMEPEEKAALVAWIDSGMERGEGADPLAKALAPPPVAKLPPKLWEVAMEKPQKVEPGGTKEYLYLQLGGPAPFDMWITAFHTYTTNPAQVHHQSIMVVAKPVAHYEEQAKRKRNQGQVDKNTDGDLPLYILDAMKEEFRKGEDTHYVRKGVWAAGRPQPELLPQGTALHIPKGHYVVLEQHYVGSGKQEEEQTRIELFGQKQKPKGTKILRSGGIYETDYIIPPNEKSFVVQSRPRTFPRAAELRSLLSHMHIRGRSLRFLVTSPEGAEKVLVSIPSYDFGWHTGAELVPEKPILIPPGHKLQLQCEFDNSASNPNNPDPEKEIRFGQTFDRAEMCKMTYGYTFADE